jgi:arylformamidase
MYVSGWSAGGHLTAMSLDHPAVRGGLAISGIYDLEPIRLSYLDEKLKLTGEEVERLSPQRRLAGGSRPIVVAYGDSELPELQRQSREYAEALAQAGTDVTLTALPGQDHFSILEELAAPDGKLAQLAAGLCGV